MAALAALAGCGHASHGGARPRPTATRAATIPTARLTPAHRCPRAPGFTCSTLRVPLDHRGRTGGTLRLAVALHGAAATPRGVLVALTGGPGQPGVRFGPSVRRHLRGALAGYRLVLLDQRGTGVRALRCPALQRTMGSSDLTVPRAGAVERCAASLGTRRRFYTTADTVEDLEALRIALGAARLTFDGVSYGTYVAERYALAHPDRVQALVLDSVVPQDNVDALSLVPMRAAARVLRAACRHCPFDPARDLAAVVAHRHDGPELLDTLTALSIVAPRLRGMPVALHEAAAGRPARLDTIVAAVRRGQRAPARALSQALHAATLCGDLRAPWGDARAPLAGRRAALARAVARLAASDVWPFDRATAAGNGIAQTCLRWPPTAVPALPAQGRDLPAVPMLLLAGDRDLSTPLKWARAEAGARTTRAAGDRGGRRALDAVARRRCRAARRSAFPTLSQPRTSRSTSLHARATRSSTSERGRRHLPST